MCYDCGEKGHIAPRCPHKERYKDRMREYLKELIARDRSEANAHYGNGKPRSKDKSRSRSRSATPAKDLVKVRNFHEYMASKNAGRKTGLINCVATVLLTLSDFPTRPNQAAYTAQEKGPNTRREDADTHWMIVDSGCNRHYLCRAEFLLRTAEIRMPIRGIGDNVVYASREGIFMGYFQRRDERKRTSWVPFTSFGLFVENSNVSLFSVSQATMTGENTIVHEGKPDTGKHGMFTADGSFIPFHFCSDTQLWWIPIRKRKDGDLICSNARAGSREMTSSDAAEFYREQNMERQQSAPHAHRSMDNRDDRM